MTTYESYDLMLQLIGIFFSFTATICSIIAIVYTYKNLKEIRNQFFEQNRGQLVFYIDYSAVEIFSHLVLKNFGNSPAKLKHIKFSPDLSWNDIGKPNLTDFDFSRLKNVFLAPNQHIKSSFELSRSTLDSFEAEICYETCGKTYTEKYIIDLKYSHHLLHNEATIKDPVDGLKQINKSIRNLSDKFI